MSQNHRNTSVEPPQKDIESHAEPHAEPKPSPDQSQSPVAVVFGGSGFIGRYLVAALAREGWRVRVASRRPARAAWLKSLGQPGQIEPTYAPLQDDMAVRAALKGATAAVNLVGLLFERGQQGFTAVHAQGAARIAMGAKSAGLKRLVHVSAIGADPNAMAKYARTKAEGEAAVQLAFPQATVLRPSLVIGMEDGFFNRFARMAQISPFLPLVAGGKTRFQPLVVHDLVAAIMAGLQRPNSPNPAVEGRLFELGGPKTYSFKALLELLLDTLGSRRILMPLPMPVARLQARVLQLLPDPPLTPDQLKLLGKDNVVSGDLPGLAELGIQAQAIETIVPKILAGYRRQRA